MGRGKSKAKHAKVARQLKYAASPTTDLEALEAELKGEPLGEDADPEDDDLFGDEELDDDELEEDEDEDLFDDDELEEVDD